MEETDPAGGEAKGGSGSSDQEEVGNVLRLPVETPSGDAADDRPPEPKSHGHPFTVVSSFGNAAREIVPPESEAPEIVAQEIVAPESSPPESVVPEDVAAQEAGPEEAGPAEPENVSPDLKELLEMAAVQAAVDAIVDAAVRGSTTGPNDELE